jgi:hypothetical protein
MRITGHLENEVRLDRRAEIGRAADVNRPAAFRQLLTPQVLAALAESILVRTAEVIKKEEVLGFEDRVPFELAAPVAVGMLQRRQAARCRVDGR